MKLTLVEINGKEELVEGKPVWLVQLSSSYFEAVLEEPTTHHSFPCLNIVCILLHFLAIQQGLVDEVVHIVSIEATRSIKLVMKRKHR